MAPSDERDQPQDSRHGDAGNPFIAFRRFADEQMSSLVHSIFGQPRKPTEPTKSAPDDDLPWIAQAMTDEQRHRLRSMWQEARREVYGVPTDQSPYNDGENAEKSHDEHARCPYRPADQDVPEQNRQGRLSCSSPRACCDGGLPANLHDVEVDYTVPVPWVIQYLDHSPYSPHSLETQELFRQQGRKWRDAFEDLIVMQNGLPLPEEVSRRRNKCNAHWVQSMLQEGLFGNGKLVVEPESAISRLLGLLKSPKKDARAYEYLKEQQKEDEGLRAAKNDEYEQDDENDADDMYDEGADNDHDDDDDEETTELDWFQRMLCPDPKIFRDRLEALASEAFKHESRQEQGGRSSTTSSATRAPTADENAKPSIISTLTTTERITHADGSTHTKMVLKKRFADGREESTETTHTTHGHDHHLHQDDKKPRRIAEEQPGSEAAKKADDETEKPQEKKKKSGWFWN